VRDLALVAVKFLLVRDSSWLRSDLLLTFVWLDRLLALDFGASDLQSRV